MSTSDNIDVLSLLTSLSDPNPSIRMAAALTLQKTGGYLDQTLSVLVNDIAEVGEENEADWQWALKLIERPAIVALANKALEASLPIEGRLLALRTIACEFYEDHAAALVQMERLLDAEGELSAWAAVILALADQPIHAHDAFRNALRSNDLRLVRRAVYALHSFKNRPSEEVRRVKESLLPCLIHSDEEVRETCCMFSKFDLDDDDLRQLNLAEDDPVNAVIAMLCKMGVPPASSLSLLMRGLFSDDYDTRVTSSPRALLRLGEASIQPVTDLALDTNQPVNARCGALRVLARMKSLPAETVQQIRPILQESGQLPIYAAVALAGQGLVDETVIDRLVAGVEDDELDVKGCLRRLPEQQTVPVLITHLKLADDRKKHELSMLLGELGWNSPAAAQAVVDEFASAIDNTLRNRLANALREFEELAVPPALSALATYGRDEQIIWLMEGLEFVGPSAISALPALVSLLDHQNAEVVFYAAKAMAAIDPTQPSVILPLLHALLADQSPRRYESMNRLKEMGESAAPCVPRLIELLDDPKYRESATQVLGWIGPAASAAIPRLAELMNASNESSSPIESLGRIQHADAVPYLIAALDNERKIKHVCKAFVWLKSVAGPAVEKLRRMLASPYRLDAVKALGDLEHAAKSAAPDLTFLLDDSDQELRIAAITTLGKLRAGGPRLIELAQDDNAKIRIAALESLGGERLVAAVPLLMAAAESLDSDTATAAFRGLAAYGKDAPVEFVPLLMQHFADGNDEIKWAVLGALERLGPTAAPSVPMLIAALSKDQYYEHAFRSLEAMGPAAANALPELERLLTTRKYRYFARSAIWKIAPERGRELRPAEFR